jgi:rhodanese-related sulfurtransferase
MWKLVFWRSYTLFLLPVLTTTVYAADAPNLSRQKIIVPDNISGVETLLAADVITKAREISDLLVIDSRIESDRQYGYIESSISLPDTQTNCDTLAQITPSKDRSLLFYCNGVECGRSVIAIKIAKSCGYTNLFWFRGGFEEWLKNGYPYVKYP